MFWEWGGQDFHFAFLFVLYEDAFVNAVLDQILQHKAIFCIVPCRPVELAILLLEPSHDYWRICNFWEV